MPSIFIAVFACKASDTQGQIYYDSGTAQIYAADLTSFCP